MSEQLEIADPSYGPSAYRHLEVAQHDRVGRMDWFGRKGFERMWRAEIALSACHPAIDSDRRTS